MRRRGVGFLAAAFTGSAVLAALGTSPATAASDSTGTGMSRAEVVARAKVWTDAHIDYDQDHRYQGYRKDCSGFLSMAWQLTKKNGGLTTPELPGILERVDKDQLATGDALIMKPSESADGEGHAVMFLNWADPGHTKYMAMEEAGHHIGAVQHVIPYPYYAGFGTFRPYHYGKVTDNAPTQNLLLNGGFEGEGGWTMKASTNLTTYHDAGKAHSGDAYGAVNTGSVLESQNPSFFQDVYGARLEIGKQYTYTLYVRPEADQPYKGRLDLWAIGEDGRQERSETPFTAKPGTWTQVTVTEHVAADGYHHLRAEMYEDTTHDTLDVDDGSLTVAS